MTGQIDSGGAAALDRSYERYTTVAIALHWAIGLLILAQLGFGFLLISGFAEAEGDARQRIFEAIQSHKAIGLTILALSVLRLAWRFWRPAPALPEGTPGWQRAVSGMSHAVLYVFMIGMPLSGWAMASTSPDFSALPTSFFGLFDVPHLPVVALVGESARAAATAVFKDAHVAMAWGMTALLVVHVAAALKHHIIDRDAILARMSPFVSAPGGALAPPSTRAGLGGWAAGAVVLAAGAGGAAALMTQGPADLGQAAKDAMADEMAEPMADAAEAPTWVVDAEASELAFGGSYFMGAYNARFAVWTAVIAFDPDNLDGSALKTVVDITSATTGDGQIDGAMQTEEYFNAAGHPTAVFEAATIRAGSEPGAYIAEGALSLRGVTAPLSLPFTLQIDGDRAVAEASVEIQRLDFSVGPEPGEDAAVAPGVMIEIKLEAVRAAGDG